MNKAELIEELATKTKTTKAECGRWLDAFTTTVTKQMKKDEVRLVGFGTFKSTKRKARVGRNPQTGAEIKIAARRVPVFKAGKDLKDKMK